MSAVACTDVAKRFGTTVALEGVSLEVDEGQIVAVLGPSGCGKTTLLRVIAGFEEPDAGSVSIGGTVMDRVPPERRRVGFVFQDYALFPHLTVGRNVAFGADAPRAREALAMVGLAAEAERFPHELSGGQQQRVALARALAPDPALILLDEPFASLDADLRSRVRGEVRQILRRAGAAAIFVTHDQQEAFEIADRVAVMLAGRIQQFGTPEEIYHVPATRFVADFVGDAEFLPAMVQDRHLTCDLGTFDVDGIEPGPLELMVRPEDLDLWPDEIGDAEVVGRRFQGPVTLSVLRLGSGVEVTAAHSSQLLLLEGDRARVAFRPDHLVMFRGAERVGWIPARPHTGTDRSR